MLREAQNEGLTGQNSVLKYIGKLVECLTVVCFIASVACSIAIACLCVTQTIVQLVSR